MATLPKQSRADRVALAQFSASDIEQTAVFVGAMTATGRARVGKTEATVSGVVARQLWQAGRQGSRFTWDRAALQFMNGSTPVQRVAVKASADAVANQARYKMLDATLRLSQGKLSAAEWAIEHDQWIKVLHGAETALGHGGLAEMRPADWESASERLSRTFGYSRAMAEDIASGRYGIPGDETFRADALLSRSGLYCNEGRCVYEESLSDSHEDIGYRYSQRVLASVNHCGQCEELAGQWFPIDEMVAIGDCQCMSNCQCVLIFSKDGEQG